MTALFLAWLALPVPLPDVEARPRATVINFEADSLISLPVDRAFLGIGCGTRWTPTSLVLDRARQKRVAVVVMESGVDARGLVR